MPGILPIGILFIIFIMLSFVQTASGMVQLVEYLFRFLLRSLPCGLD
jgi:hypothetical protein